MRLPSAILGTVVFFFVAPGIVAGALPLALANRSWPPAVAGGFPGAPFGVLLIAAGLAVLLTAFAQFALQGRGTPAPVAPTATLVVGGLYRWVRNPMYVAVLTIILGQALLFANLGILIYAAVIFITVHAFVVAYEEPTLRETYGAQYDTYARHVRRWIPRLTPWRPAP